MADSISTGYEVFISGDAVKVRRRIDGAELFSGASASEAIQRAVDGLGESGGTVEVHEGRYVLEKELRLADDVWLRGHGRATRLVLAPSHETGVGVLCKGLGGARVSDLALKGADDPDAEAGVVLDDCGDCLVHDVFLVGFAGYGVWMRNNSFLCELRGLRAAGNGKAGIFLQRLAQGGRGGDFVPNLVANCVTYGGGKGIEIENSLVVNVVACEVFQPGGVAFHVHDESNSVLISGSRSFQGESDAVVVESSHEINISSNVFCWHRGNGVVLRDVDWGLVNCNEIIDTGVRHDPYMTGVVLAGRTKGVQVTGNAIFNWGDQLPMKIGIREEPTCSHNLIAANNVNYCTGEGVLAEGEGTLVTDNVAVTKAAHRSMDRPPYPDFDRSRIEAFMARRM